MNIVDVNISEFVPLPETAGMRFTSRVLYQVYLFYKTHSQNAYYFIVPIDGYPVSSYFDVSNLDVYASYGIVMSHDQMLVSDKKQYMLILNQDECVSREVLTATINRQKLEIGCSDFASCVVECDYDELTELQIEEISACLYDVLGNSCRVLNYPLHKRQDFLGTKRHLPQYDYVDVNDLVGKSDMHYAAAEVRGKYIFDLYRRVIEYPDKENNIVFCLNGEKNILRREFAAVAAYSVLAGGKRFHYGSEVESRLTSLYMQSIFSKDNMYLEDYIKYVQEFPDLSTMVDTQAYVLVKDYTSLQSADCLFTCVQTRVDPETMCICDGVCRTVSYYFSDIQMLSLREKFSLDSPISDVAAEGMKKLTDVLQRLDQCISMNSDILRKEVLHVSNVCMFTYMGDTYLGYVPYLSTKLPFIVYPVATGFRSFRVKLDLQNVNISDIRIFYDWKKIAAQMVTKRIVKLENCIFRPPVYAKGVMLSALSVNSGLYHDYAPFTFEDLGIWSQQTRSTRNSPIILEHLRKEYLQKCGFISAYGGPHPAIQNAFRIQSDAWR